MQTQSAVTIIDPAYLSKENAELLHEFLLNDEKKGKKEKRKVFYKDDIYHFKNGINIKFTQALVRRTVRKIKKIGNKKKYIKKYVYSVFDPEKKNLLGIGSFGRVYRVSGKLSHGEGEDENSMIYSDFLNRPEKQQAIKVQAFTAQPNIPLDQMIRDSKFENEISREVEYLKAKKITFEKDPDSGEKLGSYIAMKAFQGNSLEDILNSPDILSVDQRYQLTINLLKALKYIHDLGIIHADIMGISLNLNTDFSLQMNANSILSKQ